MTISELLFLSVGLSLSAIILYIRGYASEKGKNLATREDLDSVIRAVEQVKADAQTYVERQKAVLQHGQLVNRSQYELELEAYREVWSALLPVQRATAALRPILDSALGENETVESRKQTRLTTFSNSFNPFSEYVWKHRPFFPEEVFLVLQQLVKELHKEALQYQFLDASKNRSYFEDGMTNAKAIEELVDAVAATIRVRLSHVNVA
jgi:hypothetical protein